MNDTRYTAIAAALREEFPKANKGTVSMALHTSDYGVKFCTRAQEIYDAVTQQKRHSQKRRKTFRMQCRLAESTAERVKQALERNGIASMQTFLDPSFWHGSHKAKAPPVEMTPTTLAKEKTTITRMILQILNNVNGGKRNDTLRNRQEH